MESMVEIASGPPWIPEDDLLLKENVEKGASLEALAKGAVEFSRKYTVREIRDRWRSLLYDPDISAEASACMINLELSTSNVKRKLESIRKQYCALTKRIRREDLDSVRAGLHEGTSMGVSVGNECLYNELTAGNVMADGNAQNDFGIQETGIDLGKNHTGNSNSNVHKDSSHMLGDCIVQYGNCSGVEGVVPSHALPDMPLWKTIEDVAAPTMPLHVTLANKAHSTGEALMVTNDLDGEKVSSAGCIINHSGTILKDRHCADVLNDSMDISRLPNSLLDFSHEDELIFWNIDGKDTMMDNNLDSLLLSSPRDIQEEDVPQDRETLKLDSTAAPGDITTAGSDVSTPVPDSGQGEQHLDHCPKLDLHSSPVIENPNDPEISGEFVFCPLNTEDTEIPCNDGVGSPTVVPFPSSRLPSIHKRVGDPACSNRQGFSRVDISLKKEQFSESLTAYRMVRSVRVPEIGPNPQPAGIAIKSESPGGNHLTAIISLSENVHANPGERRSADATLSCAPDKSLKEEEIDVSTIAGKHDLSKPGNDLDQEESDGDDDIYIPNFCDIEKLILEMDLCPTDQDTSKEVSRYQHVDSKRTIMRLEQCAHASMQRAIASRGALAVFHGRHLKHYMTKSEIILGRATEDIDVDVDLGIEMRSNKISRRQALIKIESNGYFFIKNIGKTSIFLNGKEVARGGVRSLTSGSLIEIKEMAFCFDIYNKAVRKFLENADRKGIEKNTNFAWLPEGGQ